MKELFTAFALLLSIFTISGQEQEEADDAYYGKHEVKINGLAFVEGAFEIGYEYLLDEESSIGISVLLPFDEDLKRDINFYVSPYYRYFFGKKYAGGFFLEGFGMLNRVDRDIDLIFDDGESDWKTDFALGIGLGGKWITKKGLIGEINFGVARNLFDSDDIFNGFIGKLGITAGYRF